MANPVKLKKSAVEKEPQLVWNAYADLLAVADFDQLTPLQRPPHLVFWYESEVRKGGHVQYFENQGTRRLAETLEGLKSLGAVEHADVLEAAAKQYRDTHKDDSSDSIAEFVTDALKSEYDEFDKRFNECPKPLRKYLEDYLEAHQAEFVEIVS